MDKKENYQVIEDHPNYPVEDEIEEIKKRYSKGCYLVNVPGQFRQAYQDIQRLLSLLSEKEKEIEDITQENTRLSNEWQECHAYNNEIVSENQKLKEKVEELGTQSICSFFDKQITWEDAFFKKNKECTEWSNKALSAETKIEELEKKLASSESIRIAEKSILIKEIEYNKSLEEGIEMAIDCLESPCETFYDKINPTIRELKNLIKGEKDEITNR